MSHYERFHVQILKTNRRWRTFSSIRVFSLAMTKCLMVREFCPHAHEFYPSSLFSRRFARLEPASKPLPPPSKPWRPPEEALPRGPPARLPASGYPGGSLANKENISEICCWKGENPRPRHFYTVKTGSWLRFQNNRFFYKFCPDRSRFTVKFIFFLLWGRPKLF